MAAPRKMNSMMKFLQTKMNKLGGLNKINAHSPDSAKKDKEVATETVESAKIRILMKSFVKKFPDDPAFAGFRKVGLPKRRKLYTVLRSPHVDKKSREQFEMRIHKQLLETDTTAQEMVKKFFFFKRMRLFGAQCEFVFNYKTRLDMSRVATMAGSDS